MIEVFLSKYIFLFIIGFIWIVFASIQDIKSTEVSNWLNYSLLVIALAYRAFYSIFYHNAMFFVYGLIGAGIFLLLGLLFYYGRIFGGGDAKLLIALGAIIPIEGVYGILAEPFGIILTLLVIGAIYSLVASVFIVFRDVRSFGERFKIYFIKAMPLFGIVIVLSVLFYFLSGEIALWGGITGFLVFVWLIYPYLRSVDENMIVLRKPGQLMEGDWIEKDIRLKNGIIRKTVHGLSLRDIVRLRKAKKSIYIKSGIPFVPVFLLLLISMAIFYFVFGHSFVEVFSFLL